MRSLLYHPQQQASALCRGHNTSRTSSRAHSQSLSRRSNSSQCCSTSGRTASNAAATSSSRRPCEKAETEVWQRLCLLQRQVRVAVSEERYELAAALRDERAAVVDALPTQLRLQLQQCETLADARAASASKRRAIDALRAYGTVFSVPTLAACLHDELLQEDAAAVMWETWMRHPDAGVRALMADGLQALEAGTDGSFADAERLFTAVVEADPSYAEGWNKRATVRFLLGRFGDSIDDCREVLARQPYHFGAWSGLGFNHVKRREFSEAADAFEAALRVHPGLPGIAQYARSLRENAAASSSSSSSADAGGGEYGGRAASNNL